MRVVKIDAKSRLTRKVSTRSGAGKEEDVFGGLPPTRLTLLYLRCLRRQAAGNGGDVHPEKDRQSPCNKVAAPLLEDVWIRQE